MERKKIAPEGSTDGWMQLSPRCEKLLHFRRVPTSATIMGIDPHRSPLGTKFADVKAIHFRLHRHYRGNKNCVAHLQMLFQYKAK